LNKQTKRVSEIRNGRKDNFTEKVLQENTMNTNVNKLDKLDDSRKKQSAVIESRDNKNINRQVKIFN
jgi:hypothetical protein